MENSNKSVIDILEQTENWLDKIKITYANYATEQEFRVVRQCAMMLKSKEDFSDVLFQNITNSRIFSEYIGQTLFEIYSDLDQNFEENKFLIRKLIKPENLEGSSEKIVNRFVQQIFYRTKNVENVIKYTTQLIEQGFSESQIAEIAYNVNNLYYQRYSNGEKLLTLAPYGYFLSKSINLDKHLIFLCDKILEGKFDNTNKILLLTFLNTYNSSLLNENIALKLLFHNTYNISNKNLDLDCGKYLLVSDIKRWENFIITQINKENAEDPKFVQLYEILEKHGNTNYTAIIDKIIKEYFQTTFYDTGNKHFNVYETYSVSFATYLVSKDKDNTFIYLKKLVDTADFLNLRIMYFINDTWKEESLPLLIMSLFKQSSSLEKQYFMRILDMIEKYDYLKYKDNIIDFAIQHNNKSNRNIACRMISIFGDKIVDQAVELLQEKTVNQRITGAIILANLETENSKAVLYEQVNIEKNDDTRDIIIDALQENLYGKELAISEAKLIIENADKRGKLNKFNEKVMVETDLPKLYWIDGNELNEKEIRFLFYRIIRSKGLNSDIEARKIIALIDKTQSGAFTRFLMKAFSDTEYNTKYKHFLTLSAMLGGNESVAPFNALFRKAISDKRVRLAEMAIESMAVIGNSKALRSIEIISRKMASKKPKLSAVATESLNAAAEELGISKDQLSDRIIPDFDFDGIYKSFEVNGEEFRAFVSNDFTLCYMDEDNKIRKSLPKDIDKDQKLFFTEVQKELKEVTKTQAGRLEHYLTNGRKWIFEDWSNAYLNHPLMTIYAQKLLWFTSDIKGQIKNIFFVQEDTSLTDIDDNEIQIEGTELVGLLHSAIIEEETLNAWKNKMYEINFKTAIPQLERQVFLPLESEKDLSVSKMFFNKDVPRGADFVKSWMDKKGWIKETGDGGYLSFRKSYPDLGIMIRPYIDGVGVWFQNNVEKATVYEINFTKVTNNEKVLIKDIPPIIYSEAMNDINGMLEAQ
ncbi:MAG: DUF4132 domain-containing protein [Saprospiraceae bacterium]|nr:DUF4132 domain-containing protein [Saprospiraceae bacterium]MBP8212219.1 DUF4132 domain-containing protein [Saprospiraceae bacterium]